MSDRRKFSQKLRKGKRRRGRIRVHLKLSRRRESERRKGGDKGLKEKEPKTEEERVAKKWARNRRVS